MTDFETLKGIFEAAGFDIECPGGESEIVLFDDIVFMFAPNGELQDVDNNQTEKVVW